MSKRHTIDFGIDLGTTNSAIAVLNGVVPEILKNNEDLDITSSAVHISKRGQLRVGIKAKEQLMNDGSVDDVYIEFKRRIGTDYTYTFRSAKRKMNPEELSAEVLKSLCGNAQQRLGEDVQAAVITVPAAFDQKQCAATKRAAEMIGLKQCPLVQEPVAAALAYGFQEQTEREYWLVYDFGGGTFDAALMKADDGVIDVVNHGGNNNLGGADIDWAIVEKIIIPQVVKEFNFPGLKRGNPHWSDAIERLKHAVEVAKIELSRCEKTFLDCKIGDNDGEIVEIDFPLTRSAVITVAEPIIMKSVKICQRVLEEKDLTPSMIHKVILVGGPTLASYFRDILTDQLKVALDYSLDPLTVVAQGAAVFASTQTLIDDGPVAKGTYKLDLNYNPVGPDEDFSVRGTVLAEGEEFNGYTISFTNPAADWDSGKIPLKADGKFKALLLAEAEGRNTFAIQLADARGTFQKITPEEFPYTMGGMVSHQNALKSFGVEINNNEFDVLIKKGTPLPAKMTKVYRTTKSLRRGDTGEMLSIPIVEGENPKADRNHLQSILAVNATSIRRDIPAGSEVEVTLWMNADRSVRARAYVTMLDDDFEVAITEEMKTPDASRLNREFEEEKNRLAELSEKSGSSPAISEQQAKISELKDLIETAQGDPDAAINAETQILELKADLDKIENESEWPRTVERARTTLIDLDTLITQSASENSEFKRLARELRAEVEQLIDDHRDDRLAKKVEQVTELHHEVMLSKDDFWVAMFGYAKEQRAAMTDSVTARKLIEQGDACLQRGAIQQLRQVVSQLMDLLPQEAQEAIRQVGYAQGDVRLQK
ncbi:Hsp70 family protein [Mariniblastus sp.]|nr:Hsp70 family protein [Mariniblastus sp.]